MEDINKIITNIITNGYSLYLTVPEPISIAIHK
jgi:hypothetical protein